MNYALLYPHPSVSVFAIRVQSRSTPDVTHDVALMAGGAWDCTCPGFTYRDECAHIPFAVQVLAALRAQVTT